MTKTKIDIDFLKKISPLVLPVALQNLINVGVSSADVFMLGKVGEIALSGVSIATQFTFIMTLVCFGFASGANVLTAQYWGKQDIKAIEKVLGICIKYLFLISLIFFIFAMFFPNLVMSIFTNDKAVALEGAKYLRVVAPTYIFATIPTAYLFIMRSVEKIKFATMTYAISLIANIIFNYIFIFGKLGFPKMGVVGAGLGTMVARLVELILVLCYNHYNKNFVHLKIKYIILNSSILKHDFFKYSIPVVLNELLWSLSVSAAVGIMGRLGSAIIASNAIAVVVKQFAMIVSFGVASASGVFIGKSIGEKNYDQVKIYSVKFIKLAFLTSLVGSLFMLAISPMLVHFFATSTEVAQNLRFMLIIMAIYNIFQSITVCLIIGIFRAGGDTKFSLFADTFCAFAISLPLASIFAFYFKVNPKIVYALLLTDEVFKCPIVYYRYRSMKWLRNVTREKID